MSKKPQPLKERMKACQGRKYKTVENVPLVGDVEIRNLTAQEQIDLAERIPKEASNLEQTAYYLANCVLDEHREPVYGENEIGEILDLDPRVLATLAAEIRDFCGIDVGVKTAAKN